MQRFGGFVTDHGRSNKRRSCLQVLVRTDAPKRSENKRVQLTCALISVLETLPSKRNKRLKRTSQTCLHPCACGETTGGWVAPKSRWGAASRVPTIGIKRLLHEYA